MKSWVLAASLLAAAFVPAASAADMGDDRDDRAYNDPRYSDPRYGDPRYRQPPAYNGRDENDDDGPPPARRYSGPAPYGQSCVRSEQVRERLTGMGWHDFQAGQPRGDLVTLQARRPNGRLFELTLHRCSGEIVEARALEPRPFGPYAFNRAPHDPYGPGYSDRWDSGPDAYRAPRWWNWRYR